MLKLLLGLFVLTTFTVNAKEINLGTDKRMDLSIAIYNENLALVNDVRNLSLVSGINNVAFSDVSALIRAESALVKGSGFFVKEQNFNYDLLSYQSLLDKSVGREVTLEYVNPGNGDKKIEKGKIISNANGSLVLKIGDKIEANYPGRVIFHSIPDTLRAKPTLVLSLNAKKSANTIVGLSYLTGGLSWKADYVAEMNKDETEFTINGLVTLNNTSGVAYENANLQLVAGSVNQVQPMMMKMSRNAPMAEMAYADTGAGMESEAFMDYYLYSVSGKVDIANNQTKQVSLLNGSAKIKKDYIYENLFNIYNSKSYAGEFEKRNPRVEVVFNNNEKEGLGIPLPAGIIRVYKADSKGKMLFAGEDRISHTPKNEQVKIKLGDAFDITAKGKRTDYKSLGSKNFEATYEVVVKNAKDTDEIVKVEQYIPSGATIISENIKSVKINSNKHAWNVKIDGGREAKLVVKIRVEND